MDFELKSNNEEIEFMNHITSAFVEYVIPKTKKFFNYIIKLDYDKNNKMYDELNKITVWKEDDAVVIKNQVNIFKIKIDDSSFKIIYGWKGEDNEFKMNIFMRLIEIYKNMIFGMDFKSYKYVKDFSNTIDILTEFL